MHKKINVVSIALSLSLLAVGGQTFATGGGMQSFSLKEYVKSSHYKQLRNACISSIENKISSTDLNQAQKTATDFRKQYGSRLLSAEKSIIDTQDYKLGRTHGVRDLLALKGDSLLEKSCTFADIQPEAVIVHEVVSGSLAENMGLKPGNVITALNGAQVSAWTITPIFSRIKAECSLTQPCVLEYTQSAPQSCSDTSKPCLLSGNDFGTKITKQFGCPQDGLKGCMLGIYYHSSALTADQIKYVSVGNEEMRMRKTLESVFKNLEKELIDSGKYASSMIFGSRN